MDDVMGGERNKDGVFERLRAGAVNIWRGMNLRRKLYLLIGCVGLAVVFASILNIQVVYHFLDNVSRTMDDNLACYKLQDALISEREAFSVYANDRNEENEAKYASAVRQTARYLNELPFDYAGMDEARYIVTWSIRNSYGVYEAQRDSVIKMLPGDDGYIRALYRTYDMQDYLDTYAARLVKMVLEEGNDAYEAQVPGLRRMPYMLLLISAGMFLFLFVLLGTFIRSIAYVLVQLGAVSTRIKQNDFSAPDVVWDNKDEIGQLVSAFNTMKHSMRENRRMQEQLHQQALEQAELERRFSFAQLQLLKSQMNPHFLFNTLNMITRMSNIEDAPVTEEMMVALANLLRYSLRTAEPFAPLAQELKVVRDYMYLQKMRFGARIRWQLICDEALYGEEVPVFLIQPVVENAIVHGLAEQENGGDVKISIERQDGKLRIEIADTGKGMSRTHLEELRAQIGGRASGSSRLGIGLGNISRRIQAYYTSGEVRVDSAEGAGTTVLIVLGARRNANYTQEKLV